MLGLAASFEIKGSRFVGLELDAPEPDVFALKSM
jgi:hypothetical protein